MAQALANSILEAEHSIAAAGAAAIDSPIEVQHEQDKQEEAQLQQQDIVRGWLIFQVLWNEWLLSVVP